MILLDTCAIIWDALEPNKLSGPARHAIEQADQQRALMIADISLWEIAMLVRKGRLQIDTKPARFLQLFLQSRQVKVQPLSPDIAELSVSLAGDINIDPADRMIAATSILHNAQLVTADQNLINSKQLDTIW